MICFFSSGSLEDKRKEKREVQNGRASEVGTKSNKIYASVERTHLQTSLKQIESKSQLLGLSLDWYLLEERVHGNSQGSTTNLYCEAQKISIYPLTDRGVLENIMRLDICKPIHSTETKGRTPPWHGLYGKSIGEMQLPENESIQGRRGGGESTDSSGHRSRWESFLSIFLFMKIFFCLIVQQNIFFSGYSITSTINNIIQ